MNDDMYKRIASGMTTHKDAVKFRLIQIGMFLLGIALILSWIAK